MNFQNPFYPYQKYDGYYEALIKRTKNVKELDTHDLEKRISKLEKQVANFVRQRNKDKVPVKKST